MADPNKKDSENKANKAGDGENEGQPLGHSTTEKEASSGENPNTQNPEEAPAAATTAQQEGANQFQEDMRGRIFGDTTSSGGDKNQAGYHGRDGGASLPTKNPQPLSHNPAPNMEQVDAEEGDAQRNHEEEASEPEVKKL